MAIIVYEMKKLLTVKRLCLLAALSMIFYSLFISFHFNHFPNGRPALDEYRITGQMLEKYGTHLNEEEWEDFLTGYRQQLKEASQYVMSIGAFREAGIVDYETFNNDQLYTTEELKQLHNQIFFEKKEDLFWELQEKERLISIYERRETDPIRYLEAPSPRQMQRFEAYRSQEEGWAVMSQVVLENYQQAIFYEGLLILFSVSFILIPVYLTDKLNRVNLLQYSARVGRKMFRHKLVAGLLSALFVTTLQLAVFFRLYPGQPVELFYQANVSSIFSSFVSWYELTFQEYILLTVGGIYLLALVITLVSAWVSNRVPNYISAIGVHLPLGILMVILTERWLLLSVTDFRRPIWMVPVLYAGLVLISGGFITWELKRERRTDVLL